MPLSVYSHLWTATKIFISFTALEGEEVLLTPAQLNKLHKKNIYKSTT